MVGHVPGGDDGGPIAALREGDMIVIDVESRRLDVELSDEEIAARLAETVAPPAKVTAGALAKYASLVQPASEGAVTTPA
jgi:dihydroxy-acid dehydratase